MSLRKLSPTPRDVALTADYRVVYSRPNPSGPGRITCAEPSPDVSRVVSSAMQADLQASAKGLANIQPEVALAIAASRAESIAQLGQRLSTVQLLRDSTYRACEAFANGAIGPATYAMIVSRYDDVIVTLLLGEIAGTGLAAAKPASLTSSAATAALSPSTGEALVKGAMARLDDAAAAKKSTAEDLAKAKQLPDGDADKANKITAAQKTADAAAQDYEAKLAQLDSAVRAVGGSSATTAGAPDVAQQSTATAADGVAARLAGMQAAYIGDSDLDAIMVGCLTALAQKQPSTDSGLTQECSQVLNKGETLRKLIEKYAGGTAPPAQGVTPVKKVQ